MSEITVILKDSERTYRQKFLSYEDFSVDHADPYIVMCIETAKKSFGSEPEEIIVKIHLEIK